MIIMEQRERRPWDWAELASGVQQGPSCRGADSRLLAVSSQGERRHVVLRALTSSRRAPPCDLIPSPRPLVLTPSRWGLGYQHVNRGHKCSVRGCWLYVNPGSASRRR